MKKLTREELTEFTLEWFKENQKYILQATKNGIFTNRNNEEMYNMALNVSTNVVQLVLPALLVAIQEKYDSCEQ